MTQYISLPAITLNMIPRGGEVGLEDHRVLIVGQLLAAGSASAGLIQDIPRSDGEINALFGAKSHLAMMARAFRAVNKFTNVDVIALEDAGGATQGTSVILWGGTATAAGTIWVDVVSSTKHSYEIDVEVGDGPADINTKLKTLIDADTMTPFTNALSLGSVSNDTITFTAANGGTISNSWMIRIRGALPAGVTATLTGWTGGATDPTLTTVFDPVANIRYQGVVWPSEYTPSNVATWIDARKNLDNDLKDGVAFFYRDDTLSNAKAESLTLNSSEVVMLWNEPNNTATFKGPHIPEAPDVIAAQMCASRALRYEPNASLNKVVVATEPLDQFGGFHTVSLPYFNTTFPNLGRPERGTGATYEERRDARDYGVALIGANRQYNGVISGVITTTYQNDGAGNDDDTWQFLNWRDTHSAIREYYYLNYKKRFAQYRLTAGEAVSGYAIADEPLLRSYAMRLYKQLSEQAITVSGKDAEKYFREHLVITVKPAERKVEFAGDFPIVSQFEMMLGTVKFSFGTE